MGDNAILAIFMGYFGLGLVLAAIALAGGPILRRVQARRIAALARPPAAAPDVAAVMRQVDAALQTVELELRDLSTEPEARRGATQDRVLEDLALLDRLFGQLRALRPSTPATYSPAIAKLHSLAAKSGVRWTPPRA